MEMNAHVAQSYEASTELEEIAAVPHQIITPRDAKPIIGVVQDTLVGSYRITRPGNEFNLREYMNLMMWNKRFDGQLPQARAGDANAPRWTGQQVVSVLLPPLNLSMPNSSYEDQGGENSENYIKIVEGDIKQGTIDKSIFSKPSKGIIHTTYNDYGAKDTVNMIDSFQHTIEQYLILNGFSVGISDLIADGKTKEDMDVVIKDRKDDISKLLHQIHLDLFDNNTGKKNHEEFESRVFASLNKATEQAGKIGQSSLSNDNRMMAMVRAGSKGGTINIAQMMACVGQQNIEGKRIPYGYTDRTLPHYKKYDDGAEARGFVESSFIRGLTPQEFFFHAMSGREGLIDTAVKTADTGYIQRKLVKGMEDLVVQHDGTVRDANMNVVQFHYGEDGVNATKIEAQALNLGKLSESDIKDTYSMGGVDFSTVFMEGVERESDEVEIDRFIKQVLKDRKMIVEGVFGGGRQGGVYSPVNIERLITNLTVKFGLTPATKTDLTPVTVLAGIQKVLQRTQEYHRIWAALLRYYLAPHKIIVENRFTKAAFEAMCEILVVKNWQSWVQPGELVGILAAQSIGEPSTQMTLNTFHLAGVASKSNVTRGVPRLKELLTVTQNPKATSLTVYLKPEFRELKEKAREVAQDLELTLLRDITMKAAIYYDPTDETTILKEDKDVIDFYKLFEQTADAGEEDTTDWSKWMMRIELDREKMFNKNITINDVAFVLRDSFGGIDLVYTDYNSKKLMMRIRVPKGTEMDDLQAFKKFQNKVLNGIVIRGVTGIKSATFREDKEKVVNVDGKYEAVKQYIIDTDGSNYLEVMNHPAVDGNRLYSTNVLDVYEQLGVEAARNVLLTEITTLFEEVGVNYRHLGLLCDVMTRPGKLMSIDRYGINKSDIGPIAKASFEETERILLRASQFGEVDPITGVSANIMVGQPIRGGTNFSSILLDEDALVKMSAGITQNCKIDAEEDDMMGVTEDEMVDEMTDPCATSKFNVNIAMPKVQNTIIEDDMELVIM